MIKEATCEKCHIVFLIECDHYDGGQLEGLCEKCLLENIFPKAPIPIQKEKVGAFCAKKGSPLCTFLSASCRGFFCLKGSSFISPERLKIAHECNGGKGNCSEIPFLP